MRDDGLDRGSVPEQAGWPDPETPAFFPAEQRLLRLLAEFRRRQRERPDMVVRPWWAPVPDGSPDPSVGFVVEYCPEGHTSAELRVRADRATAQGPAGARDATMCLRDGWVFDGRDVRGPELMANHLLRLASWSLKSA